MAATKLCLKYQRGHYSVNYSEKHYGLLYFEIVTPFHGPYLHQFSLTTIIILSATFLVFTPLGSLPCEICL